MAKDESSYKRVSLEDATTDAEVKRRLSTLDEPWQPQKARFQIAGILAIGLLLLFSFTILFGGCGITALVTANVLLDKTSSDSLEILELMIGFATTLVPYVLTPLGVALGYFFRQTQEG